MNKIVDGLAEDLKSVSEKLKAKTKRFWKSYIGLAETVDIKSTRRSPGS